MNQAAPILSYGSIQSPAVLTLEEWKGGIRVIFPALPSWAYLLNILAPLMLAIGYVCLGLKIIITFHHLFKLSLFATVSLMRTALIAWDLQALLWGTLAMYCLWKYNRWGRVPRVLTADENGLTLSRLGWLRMSEKWWPREQIVAIEFRPVAGNLSRRRTVADLYVRRSRGWRRNFRLSSTDPALPRRIAERLSAVLGCPLKA